MGFVLFIFVSSIRYRIANSATHVRFLHTSVEYQHNPDNSCVCVCVWVISVQSSLFLLGSLFDILRQSSQWLVNSFSTFKFLSYFCCRIWGKRIHSQRSTYSWILHFEMSVGKHSICFLDSLSFLRLIPTWLKFLDCMRLSTITFITMLHGRSLFWFSRWEMNLSHWKLTILMSRDTQCTYAATY